MVPACPSLWGGIAGLLVASQSSCLLHCMPTNHRWAANASQCARLAAPTSPSPVSEQNSTQQFPQVTALALIPRSCCFSSAWHTFNTLPHKRQDLAYDAWMYDVTAEKHVKNGLFLRQDWEVDGSAVPALTTGINNSQQQQQLAVILSAHQWKRRAACVSQQDSRNLEYVYYLKDHQALDANNRKSVKQCYVVWDFDNWQMAENYRAGHYTNNTVWHKLHIHHLWKGKREGCFLYGIYFWTACLAATTAEKTSRCNCAFTYINLVLDVTMHQLVSKDVKLLVQ